MCIPAFAQPLTALSPSFRQNRYPPLSRAPLTNLSYQRRSHLRHRSFDAPSSSLGPPSTQAYNVICFGELLYDLMSKTPNASLSDNSAWSAFPGGCPANVAACLSALGTRVSLVSTVGDDRAGHALKHHFAALGVDTRLIQHAAQAPTRHIYVRRFSDGERQFVGFNGDNAAFADTTSITLDSSDLDENTLVISGTMGAAFAPSGESLLSVLENSGGAKVVIDVNWRQQIWGMDDLWTEVDARNKILDMLLHFNSNLFIVKASTEDIAFLFGEYVAISSLEDPCIVRQKFQLKGNTGVIVTDGENGASCAFGNDTDDSVLTVRTAAFTPATGVVDTTGAGDAFIAGFVSEWINKGAQDHLLNDPQYLTQIMWFAAKVAAVVVSGDGATEPLKSRSQVVNFSGSF